jgi:hypothetical protein
MKMPKGSLKKVLSDNDVKKKAVKLVITHLKKKLPNDFLGAHYLNDWLEEMKVVLEKEEFILVEYIQMRKNLNDVIERMVDEEIRFKLRDSWYSMGKALDKKAKRE